MTKRVFMLTLAFLISIALVAAGCGNGGTKEGESDGGNAGNGQNSDQTFVGDQVDYEIIGIDPGAGLMQATERAIKEYGLEGWKLVEGSSAAMAAALAKAYENQEPIIVTGWTPHWMFAKFDLKYLEDPKGVYGGEESIHTVVRQGLKEDHPIAYEFLDRFEWTADDMAEVMVAIQEGKDEAEAAEEWVEANSDKVNPWIEGLEKADGDKLTLAYVAWDSEIASTNVVKYVLENKLGYKVEMLQVEAGPMFAGVAGGDADGMVAAWLPVTHQSYMEKYKDQVVDLGPNLKGTKIGLVVPTYMDIESIEDLVKK